MINDVRGGHVSPGVYMEERDVAMKAQSRGITSLGLVGETLYGPAFQNVEIEDWSEFLDYFGGTSTEKIKIDSDYKAPKYELPYIAKSYLEESRRLNVVRVLGLSGYEAGKGFVLTDKDNNAVCVIREKKAFSGTTDECGSETYVNGVITSIKIAKVKYTPNSNACNSSSAGQAVYSKNKFNLTITISDSNPEVYTVSFNKNNSDYIVNALKNSKVAYVEGVYKTFELEDFGETTTTTEGAEGSTPTTVTTPNNDKTFVEFSKNNYKSMYRAACTPWFVSQAEVKEGTNTKEVYMKKLFKLYTISDGEAANYQIKVSIQNIRPDEGYFDVLVRDYNDTDVNPLILEKFTKCSLNEGDASFIGFKIGTIDGRYAAKSKYVLVDIDEAENLAGNVPCGFIGYPMHSTTGFSATNVTYLTEYKDGYNKKNFFGINVDGNFYEDVLKFKGNEFNDVDYNDFDSTKLNAGFHLDSRLSGATKVYVNGGEFKFDTVSTGSTTESLSVHPMIGTEESMEKTIYSELKMRKFTTCFYGGFDGWDINRDQRTNTNEFAADKYVVGDNSPYKGFADTSIEGLNLPSNANTSDYYAYLAGYMVLSNPQDIEINILATPGIDWYNNSKLTHAVINMVEDSEYRGGDCLYVMNSPENMTPEELASAFEESEINSSYVCTYFPWITFFDKTNNKYINLSPTKDVVRNMAAVDNNQYSWFATAGLKRGNVNCLKAAYKTNLTDEDVLYESMINPIKSFAGDGVRIWGNKTAYKVNSPLNRVNVRRMMLRLKKLVYDASKELIFEQYDETLEQQFKGIVEPILNDIKSKRGIYDARLVVESTPEMKDEHLLAAKIMVKPTPALEYISLSFVVYPESVDFDEA